MAFFVYRPGEQEEKGDGDLGHDGDDGGEEPGNQEVWKRLKYFLMGEPSLKKMGKFGKNSQRGGLKKTDENSQFQFGNIKNPGGGLNFSKMSELSKGGGSSLIGNFSQIFPFFFNDASPKASRNLPTFLINFNE